MTQHVPTNGFNAPPAGGQPPASNMNPGWVPQGAAQQVPAQGQPPQPAQGAVPAGQPPADTAPDMSAIVGMLQQALASQGAQGGAEQSAAPAPAASLLQVPGSGLDLDKLNDPVIKSMATAMTLVSKDFDIDRAVGRAISEGNANLIDLAYIRDAGGANAPHLAELAKGMVQAVADKAAAVTREVYNLVGGEQNWATSVAAFNKAAPHELRVTIAQMMDSTNEGLIKAGAKIVAEFGKSSGMLPKAPQGFASAAAASSANALSKAQFQQELRKLNPADAGFVQAREALFARRTLGKGLGL